MRLSELGEVGLLTELERRGLAQRIENDGAVLDGGMVVTQDALVENVHFVLDWTSWRDLGYKAAAVNISDLALIVSLAVPPDTEAAHVLELYEGLNEPGVPILGGDTTAAERVYLSVTAAGRAERIPGRAGAVPGDRLVVTGSLGAAAAGYLCLKEGIASPLVEAHLRPPLRVEEGRALAREAHALIDISDGLAADAGHIARRSRCRIVIDLEDVPVADGVAEIAERFGRNVWELACGFGEDYELLAAVSEPAGRSAVGRCEVGSGVEIRLEGKVVSLKGWEHFR